MPIMAEEESQRVIESDPDVSSEALAVSAVPFCQATGPMWLRYGPWIHPNFQLRIREALNVRLSPTRRLD